MQGGIGACCTLISLEGYVNVLQEEQEYITLSLVQSPSLPPLPFLSLYTNTAHLGNP